MTASIDFQALAVNGVLGLHPYQPGKPIEELERELGISDTLKLASNENPLGASSQALRALQDPLQTLHLYPDGSGFALKNKLAETLSLDPEQITLGNGSNDVLDLIARCFLDNTSNAIFSQHAFAVYNIVTQATGAESRVAPAHPAEHSSAYGHDLDAMLALIDKQTRLIFIANPNNPTGTWLSATELDSFLQQVPNETIVVIDEAYFEYVAKEEYPDTTQWLKRFPNLIVTRTFSKIYGLAALRVGYAASHPNIADLLNRVRQPFNVNTLALAAATAALDDKEQVVMSAEINRDGLSQWETACADNNWSFIPSIGNFLCVEAGNDAMGVYDALLHKGVIVRPVANYELPKHLRITIGTQEQNQRCIQALEQILND